ncbi:LysR family transcriptional regulator [Nguyenibacter sp. L1]|uniref:LysR family transcriptional regulator n=1 Tax=Nguyenibacter sp. L1 TaxID=3049350 RepID=UPI002B471328|nr:LysR family transcriptional regulator [Nguyenibacter sp. L1]WRH87793.1 LysR family transcriptional regulator [Nguyenibacter sp. L1]
MQIRALRLLVELAEARSIRQVARRHGLSATAIVRQIDQIEHFFGTPLFERDERGIRVTEAGRLVAERARAVLFQIDDIHALLDDMRGLRRGQITIQVSGGVVAGLVSPMMHDLQTHHPGLRFSVAVSSAAEVIAAIRAGRAELGVTMFVPDDARPLIRMSRPITHAAIVGPNHPLAGRDAVGMRDLAAQRLALPDPSFGLRQWLERAASRIGVRLDPVFVTASLDMQRELAIRDAAVLVLPPSCCRREIDAGLLRAVPLAADCAIDTTLDIACQPGRRLPFAARAFMRAIERVMADDRRPPV